MMTSYENLVLRLWPLMAIGAFIIAGIIGFKLKQKFDFRRDMLETEDGVKVVLYLSYNNFANKMIDDIVIKDFVPETLEPSNFKDVEPDVTETGSGKQLEWKITELEPGEGIELSYMLKPDFDYETEIKLTPAELEVKGRKMKETDDAEATFKPGEST